MNNKKKWIQRRCTNCVDGIAGQATGKKLSEEFVWFVALFVSGIGCSSFWHRDNTMRCLIRAYLLCGQLIRTHILWWLGFGLKFLLFSLRSILKISFPETLRFTLQISLPVFLARNFAKPPVKSLLIKYCSFAFFTSATNQFTNYSANNMLEPFKIVQNSIGLINMHYDTSICIDI